MGSSKSWDDVFPDGYPLDFSVSKTDKGCMFDLDVQEMLARHWRSNSAVDLETLSSLDMSTQSFRNLREGFGSMQKGFEAEKKQPNHHRLVSLEKDVAELQTRFEGEQAMNKILKKALGKASSVTPRDITPKPTQDLIKEIAMLELEVTHLEQHLLLLYRKAFEQSLKWSSYDRKSQNVLDREWIQTSTSKSAGKESSPHEHYNQSQSSTESWQDSPQERSFWSKTGSRRQASACNSSKKEWSLCSSYSQPISFPQENQPFYVQVAKEEQQDITFLSSREGTPCRDTYSKTLTRSRQSPLPDDPRVQTANKLSEDLVRCMAAIYCKLAEPPLLQHGPKISPSTSSSSASTFSAQWFSSDGRTSQCRTDASYEVSLDDPNQENCTTDCRETTTSTFEVQWICVDNERLMYAAQMLRTFRSLVQQLEGVDPGQMKHEQKLAFWINVHNALMMHAYLAYGIPRNHLKRIALLQKAAYKIGAHSINVQTIEQTILKCRSHRPAKWLQSFLSPVAKFRGEERQTFTIDNPEPLLYFALCCGGRSDPVVRVYTEKSIYQELEAAKREFLHANVSVRREGKVQLPSMLESFAKEACMKPIQLLEWVGENVEGKLATFISRCTLQANGKAHRCIEWSEYDFTFRYVFVFPLSNYTWPLAS